MPLLARARTAWRAFRDALSGVITKRSPYWRSGLQIGDVTPERIEHALQSASSTGDRQWIGDIHDLMPGADSHLRGIRSQLRAGVAGIKMGIIPVDESAEAQAVADLVSKAEERPGVNNLTLLYNIIEGSLRGVSLTEVIWEEPGLEPVRYWKGFRPVPEQQLRHDPVTGSLALVTDGRQMGRGVPVGQLLPGKFVRAEVDLDVTDFSLRGTYRSIIDEWFGRLNAKKWEQLAIERYGMPIPVGKYATATSHNALLKAMQEFGAAGMLLIDDKSSVEWGPVSVGTSSSLVHEVYLAASAERITLALLGATQTATIAKDAGSKQSADTHAGIRRDILYGLLDLVATAKRRDLWMPFVRLNLGEQYVHLTPTAKPEFDEPLDLLTTAQAWDILVNRLGYPMAEEYIEEETGVERLKPGQQPLKGAPPAPSPFGGSGLAPGGSLPPSPGAPPPPLLPPAQEPQPAAESAPAPAPVPPPLPFRRPMRGEAAAPKAEEPVPEKPIEPPPGFGNEISDYLRGILDAGGDLRTLAPKLKRANPPVTKTADALAAAMLDSTMRALAEEPAPEEEDVK